MFRAIKNLLPSWPWSKPVPKPIDILHSPSAKDTVQIDIGTGCSYQHPERVIDHGTPVKKTKRTPEETAALKTVIETLWQQGKSYSVIAKELSIGPGVVAGICRRAGLRRDGEPPSIIDEVSQRRRSRAETEALRAKIAPLWQQGKSYEVIGKELGIGAGIVSGICKRAGLRRGKHTVVNSRTIEHLNTKRQLITAPPPVLEDIGGGVRFMDLERHHCRWVLGYDDECLAVYCGQHTANPKVSWCPEHSARVWSPLRRRRVQAPFRLPR